MKRKQRVRDYSWAKQIEAICITVIRGGDRRVVLEAFDAKPESEHQVDFATADAEWAVGKVTLQLWNVGEHLVVVEPNGFFGSLPQTLLPMVKRKDAVAVFWNVSAHMRVLVVEAGKIVRDFDPLLYDDGGQPLPEEAGLGFGDPEEDVCGGAMNVLERRLGVVLTEEAVLRTARPTFFGRPNY